MGLGRLDMEYRRFGQAGLRMPVLTCGGMRFQQSWQDVKADGLDPAGQANVEAIVRRAFEVGITHFETARGYGSSEVQLGLAFPRLPRERILVQTKMEPKDSEEEFLRVFDQSLRNLRLDYVDLLAIHGVNTAELLDRTLRAGSLRACRKLQAEGRVRHVGFSTHGPTEVIVQAIETGEFAYVNLHWYYMDQRNGPAVEAARRRDMGVFIISPSDKGGLLYTPPAKLSDLCRPFTPMGFNDLFCLARPGVHTLSLGVARPSDFGAHLAILPYVAEAASHVQPVMTRLRAAMMEALGEEWADHWHEGLPEPAQVPGEVPLYQVLRLYTLAKAFDMVDYGRMRYNLLGSGDHWFPGNKVDRLDWDRFPDCVRHYRFASRLPAILKEAHAWFNAEDQGRLSRS